MGLVLSRRAAVFSNSFTINAEMHGPERLGALDLPFSEFAITEEELPELMLVKNAYKLLYRKVKGGPDEPVWQGVCDRLPLLGKVKGASVTLFLGRKKMKLLDATLSKLVVKPQAGGVTQLAFQVRARPNVAEADAFLESLFERVGTAIPVEIDVPGYGEQEDLPLQGGEEQTDVEDGDGGEDEGDE